MIAQDANRDREKLATLVLARTDVKELLEFTACIEAVRTAFRLYAETKATQSGLMHIDSGTGEFHVKAGAFSLPRSYFALKCNGGFFQNMQRFGMPSIQGIILLCDGDNGFPLAVMDSTEVTIQRTGAATAVAASYLARQGSTTATICGCGNQGAIQLKALKTVLPISRAYVFDIDEDRARAFAQRIQIELQLDVEPVAELREATLRSDVCVTCTPSRSPFLGPDDVRPGTFIAAMGADSPEKQELDSRLLCSNKVVVDLIAQASQVGEFHHALKSGMRPQDVHAQLGEVVAGTKPGRISDSEIIVFDGTGTALQDVAAAAAVYERALTEGRGQIVRLFA